MPPNFIVTVLVNAAAANHRDVTINSDKTVTVSGTAQSGTVIPHSAHRWRRRPLDHRNPRPDLPQRGRHHRALQHLPLRSPGSVTAVASSGGGASATATVGGHDIPEERQNDGIGAQESCNHRDF